MSKIQARLMIEILGRPPENVKEALNTITTKIGSESGVKIINKQYHEPIPAQDSKDLFTAFVEIEAEFDTIENYLGIVFAYMPSNVEMISPEKITLSNAQLSEIASKITQRLHDYDAITKRTLVERDIVLQRLREVAPEEFKRLTTPPQQVRQQPKSQEPKKKAKNPKKRK